MNKELIILNGIKFMNVKGYHFPEGWIEACLQWLFEEHSQEFNQVSLDKWCSLIEQQWLFTDLRELEKSSILDRNNLADNFTFSGIICLQIMQFADVSKSFYGQIQDINGAHGIDNDLGSEEQKEHTSRRSLQLHLTDGLNNIIGFEFSSWNHIKSDVISCGCKCQLQGPFSVIRGIAFLKQKNIIILGGEVEDMKNITRVTVLEELLQQNITKHKLGSKNKPNSIVTNKQKMKKELKKEDISEESRCIKKEVYPKILSHRMPEKSLRITEESRFIQKEVYPKNLPQSTSDKSVPISEESRCIQKEVYPKKLPHSMQDQSPNRSNLSSFENSMNISRNLLDVKAAKVEQRDPSLELNAKVELPSPRNSSQDTCINFDDDDDEFLKAVEDIPDIKSTEIPEPKENKIIVDNETFLIDIFKELANPESDSIVSKQYRVKALIIKFLTKLTTDIGVNGQYVWKLQLRISDGTSSLDCQLSDGFMTSRIGFSANMFHEMKQTSNIEQLKAAIKEFQKEIIRSDCGMYTLQLSESCDRIEIVEFANIDSAAVESLKHQVARLV